MNCRHVQDLLPEYVTGRFVRDRERIAGHLSRCEACDTARRELEAVFALLADTPEAPESLYGEANTRLALQTAFGPGPMRSMEEQRSREDRRFRLCAAFSFTGMGLLGISGALFRSSALSLPNLPSGSFEGWPSLTQSPLLWPTVALVMMIGSSAALLPVLIQHARTSTAPPPARREASS